jgi:hypothetical protein
VWIGLGYNSGDCFYIVFIFKKNLTRTNMPEHVKFTLKLPDTGQIKSSLLNSWSTGGWMRPQKRKPFLHKYNYIRKIFENFIKNN